MKSNRFECLKGTGTAPVVFRQNAGRFECLRDEYQPPPYTSGAGRFDCLGYDGGCDTVYLPPMSPITITTPCKANTVPPSPPPLMALSPQAGQNMALSPQAAALEPVYLPRPSTLFAPLPSTLPGPAYVPPHRAATTSVATAPVPVMNMFPELPSLRERQTASHTMPEAKEQTMIVAPIIVQTDKRILTSLCMRGGKVERREIYEDGTELPDGKPIVIVKKPTYMSWAGVIRHGENDVVYN